MSKQLEWNGLVRVTVGEMNRAHQLDYSAAVNAVLDDETEFQAYLAAVDELMIVHSPCRVEVCVAGQWQIVRAPQMVGDDLDGFTLQGQMDANAVRALPTSLFHLWNSAAMDVNPYIRNLFLSATQSLLNTPPTSAPLSASEGLPAPISPKSPATKTTGRNNSRKTSSGGSATD